MTVTTIQLTDDQANMLGNVAHIPAVDGTMEDYLGHNEEALAHADALLDMIETYKASTSIYISEDDAELLRYLLNSMWASQVHVIPDDDGSFQADMEDICALLCETTGALLIEPKRGHPDA